MIQLQASQSYLLRAECVPTEITDQFEPVDVLKFDAGANLVKDLRAILLQANSSPLGLTRLLIIENAHLLTEIMQNTLLKILEEPCPHLIIVVQTPLANKLLPTVLSRLSVIREVPKLEQTGGTSGDISDLKKARDRDELGRLIDILSVQTRQATAIPASQRYQRLALLEQALSRVERNCNYKLVLDGLLLHWPAS